MWKYDLIVKYLKQFEQKLDDSHELWIKFPAYDSSFSLKETVNGADEFIAFDLRSEDNEHFSVIQSYSQLNFAVFAKPRTVTDKQGKSMGFVAN